MAGDPPSPTAPEGRKKQVTNLTWGSILLIFHQIWGTDADFLFFFYQIRGWSIFITGPSEPGDRWCNLPPINFQNDKRALFEYKSAFFHDENQLLTSLSLFNSGSFKVNLLLTALFYYFSFASIGFTFNYLILKNAFVI